MLSLGQAWEELGIPVDTVRTWLADRKRTGLYPMGLDGRRSRMLFYEADLIAVRRGLPMWDEHGNIRVYTMYELGKR